MLDGKLSDDFILLKLDKMENREDKRLLGLELWLRWLDIFPYNAHDGCVVWMVGAFFHEAISKSVLVISEVDIIMGWINLESFKELTTERLKNIYLQFKER